MTEFDTATALRIEALRLANQSAADLSVDPVVLASQYENFLAGKYTIDQSNRFPVKLVANVEPGVIDEAQQAIIRATKRMATRRAAEASKSNARKRKAWLRNQARSLGADE